MADALGGAGDHGHLAFEAAAKVGVVGHAALLRG
jgi:hypothetical protein